MKGVIVALPILLALGIAPAISIMIFARTGKTYRDVIKSVLVFGSWCALSFLMMLFLLGYVSGPNYVRGYEPPVGTRAMKYLGLVSAYGLIGLALVWGIKQKKA